MSCVLSVGAACDVLSLVLDEPTYAQVAQLVEQRTENPCVDSSTLSLGTRTV
jgi:hypothetical protein